jgi:hypothetical protein
MHELGDGAATAGSVRPRRREESEDFVRDSMDASRSAFSPRLPIGGVRPVKSFDLSNAFANLCLLHLDVLVSLSIVHVGLTMERLNMGGVWYINANSIVNKIRVFQSWNG